MRRQSERFPESGYGLQTKAHLLYHAGRLDSLQHLLDDTRAHGRPDLRSWVIGRDADLALLHGRVVSAVALFTEAAIAGEVSGGTRESRGSPIADSAAVVRMELSVRGSSPRAASRLDATLARSPLRALDVEDRPYFGVAVAYARAGAPDRAHAMMAEYDREVRDTALRRSMEPRQHSALGEIALAENRPADAMVEFRKADQSPDGPSDPCSICLPINLARAFDESHQRDSAIVMYERYLDTPFFERIDVPHLEVDVDPLDPAFLAGVHRRLGALYEEKGDAAKALVHYRAFVEQWKNADADLQPMVATARERIAKLAPVEKRP